MPLDNAESTAALPPKAEKGGAASATAPGSRAASPFDVGRIAAAAAGDRDATEALLMQLLPRVRNLTRYLVRGDSDVDDLAQEGLIGVMRGLSSYRAEGSFQAWADRVVARVVFAALRRARTERGRRHEGTAVLEGLPSPGPGLDQYSARRDLARMLDQLPTEQRHALVLHGVMGMSVSEVAEELGVPFETVRSRLRVGKASLRALHAESPAEGGAE
jgi:RNA polymerase sigma-70 factor, ECF subfamily